MGAITRNINPTHHELPTTKSFVCVIYPANPKTLFFINITPSVEIEPNETPIAAAPLPSRSNVDTLSQIT